MSRSRVRWTEPRVRVWCALRGIAVVTYAGNAHARSTFHHPECGMTWSTSFNHVRKGSRCPRCSGRERVTTETVVEFLDSLGYELVEYAGNVKDRSTFHHPDCGMTWSTKFHHIRRGRRCPRCRNTGRYCFTTLLRLHDDREPRGLDAGAVYLVDFDTSIFDDQEPERYVKVGITTNDRRTAQHERDGGIVRMMRPTTLLSAFRAEQRFQRQHRDQKYRPTNPRMKGGHTECVHADTVIDLDVDLYIIDVLEEPELALDEFENLFLLIHHEEIFDLLIAEVNDHLIDAARRSNGQKEPSCP